MDVEKTCAIEHLVERMDRLETQFFQRLDELSSALSGIQDECRASRTDASAGLATIRDDLASNANRTYLLFQAVRGDIIKLLGQRTPDRPKKDFRHK